MFMLSFRSVPKNKTVVGNICGVRLMHEQIQFYIHVHITMNNPEKEYKRQLDQVAHLKTPLKGLNMNGVFRLATRFIGLTSNSCIQFNISFRLPESKLIQKPTSIVIRLLVSLLSCILRLRLFKQATAPILKRYGLILECNQKMVFRQWL